jgi:hypothetical protein
MKRSPCGLGRTRPTARHHPSLPHLRELAPSDPLLLSTPARCATPHRALARTSCALCCRSTMPSFSCASSSCNVLYSGLLCCSVLYRVAARCTVLQHAACCVAGAERRALLPPPRAAHRSDQNRVRLAHVIGTRRRTLPRFRLEHVIGTRRQPSQPGLKRAALHAVPSVTPVNGASCALYGSFPVRLGVRCQRRALPPSSFIRLGGSPRSRHATLRHAPAARSCAAQVRVRGVPRGRPGGTPGSHAKHPHNAALW